MSNLGVRNPPLTALKALRPGPDGLGRVMVLGLGIYRVLLRDAFPPCGPRKWMPESPTFKWLDPSQPTKIDEDLIEFWMQ